MKVTRKQLRLCSARYTEAKIATLMPAEGLTPLEFAALDIPVEDRLWVLLRKDIIPARELRLLACDWAEAACVKAGWSDERSIAAIAVGRRFAVGEATEAELAEAASAAWAASDEVVAARAAAWSTERSAERSARLARSAAEAAAALGPLSAWAAWSNALAEARAKQLADVVKVLKRTDEAAQAGKEAE